eukprot:gene12054-12144_t
MIIAIRTRYGELIIAHINPFFKSDKTLESLYLQPLAQRIAENNGSVYKGYGQPVILMIDIKTGADNTYKALKSLLEKAVTIVLSGHKPYRLIKQEKNRLAFIDEDLRKTSRDTTAANVYKLAKRTRLCAYVSMAHKYGKKVRLWASPENKIVWKELLKCGVDLINTDKLAVLKDFLLLNAQHDKFGETAMVHDSR